jgi:hypothetical protein
MGIIILAAIIAAALLVYHLVENHPQKCFFIYRFSGTLFITFCFLLLPFCITDKAFIPVFPIIGLFFYPVWLAKVSALCIHSENKHWAMLLLKFYFSIVWLVVFPLGIFSEYLYQKFEVEKTQDRMVLCGRG